MIDFVYLQGNSTKTTVIMCKVLILQGSPRANGNTAWMAEEYKGGVRDVDNIVEGIRLPKHRSWQVENMGFVSAKIDEQKTEETKQKVIELANKL